MLNYLVIQNEKKTIQLLKIYALFIRQHCPRPAEEVEICGSAVSIRKCVPRFRCQMTKRIKTIGSRTDFRWDENISSSERGTFTAILLYFDQNCSTF